MVVIFWIALCLIFYAYVGYTCIIFVLSIFINNPVRKKDIEPSVSLLIAAYNEEKNIIEKIKNSLSLDYPKDKLEIIVVSDGSRDNTDNIVKGYKGIRLYRTEGRIGKTEARNQAVKIAQGEIIIFSDATTVYNKDVVRKMVRNFNDPKVGLVSGRYQYRNKKNVSTGWTSILFWNYENFIKSKQTKIKTLTGASGCINSFKKKLYSPLPPDIIEDLVEPLKILEKGYRIVFEPEALAFENTTENIPEEFKMRVRVISGGMIGIWYVKKLLNPLKYPFVSFQLISHKVFRWAVPFFAIILLSTSIFLIQEALFYKLIFILQLTFYFFATLGFILEKFKIKMKIFYLPLYFCTLNIASLIAFVKTLTGKIDVKWETIR